MSPYTAIVRRSGNPFELAHVLVSWLIGAGYEAYVAVGCATRDVCLAIRYRTICPELPDDNPVRPDSRVQTDSASLLDINHIRMFTYRTCIDSQKCFSEIYVMQ